MQDIDFYYLWVLLSQTRDAIVKVRERELLSQGISERHAQLLFVIKLIGRDATPAKVARWVFREPHTISEILNRMEKQGLIRKVNDLDRKNHVRIEITKKGEDEYRRSFIPRSIPDILSVLPKGEREQFIGSLKKLREAAVEKINPKYDVPLPPIDGWQ